MAKGKRDGAQYWQVRRRVTLVAWWDAGRGVWFIDEGRLVSSDVKVEVGRGLGGATLVKEGEYVAEDHPYSATTYREKPDARAVTRHEDAEAVAAPYVGGRLPVGSTPRPRLYDGEGREADGSEEVQG
jgi:hypothetical protein